jgi:hypothetical protein
MENPRSATFLRSTTLTALLALSLASVACNAEVDGTVPEGPEQGESEDSVTQVSSENVGIIVFDGTGNNYAQNGSMVKLFRDSPLPTVGAPTKYSFPGQTKSYFSYTRSDAQGGLRAVYYEGPPEGVLEAAFRDDWDSGASYIQADATAGEASSPVCRVVNNPRVKKVFVVGYSRGAVIAADVARRIGSVMCGSFQGAKLSWVGLIDPVATGMTYPKLSTAECEKMDPGVFNHTFLDTSCIAPPTYLDTVGRRRFIPVSLFSKQRRHNGTGLAIKLATSGVPNAYVDAQFDAPGAPQDVHIAMASNSSLLAKVKAAARSRGGYGF